MSKESVLVCGSGIAGLAATLGLTRAGLDVSLIGPQVVPAPVSSETYCPRVYAISAASQSFLDRLGVWTMMDSRRLTPVETMEVYGDGGGALHLHAWQAAQTTLAWIVEASEMERALQQAVQVFGISWHPEKFQRMESRTIFTDTGRSLKADLLVGADGAKSPVRTAAGIHHESRPYGDIGLVVHLTAELPHQHIALQWFTGDSVLALLPLPDTSQGHQVSMVWSMPQDDARELMAMPELQRNIVLETRLAAATGGRLGVLKVRSTLSGFPLFLEHSGMVAPGVALVSDAAHRVHPLAGQGLNLGLADVDGLIQVLRDKEAFRSIGDLRVLSRYRRARAEPIMAMRIATHGLHGLFASQAAPVVWGRNAGMRFVDRLPFMKRMLIGGASGK